MILKKIFLIFTLLVLVTFKSYSQSLVKPDYGRGVSEAINGNYISAIDLFSYAINIDSNNSMAYNNRGLCYLLIGKSSLALIDFNKAIKLDSQNPFFFSNRATLYAKLNQINKAYADDSISINLNKSIGLFYYNRAICQSSMSIPNYHEIIDDLTKSISLKTIYSDHNVKVVNDNKTLFFYEYNLAYAYYNRGFINAILGLNINAINDYKKSIELKPSADAYYNLAHVYVQESKFEMAIEELTNSIKINPNYSEAYGYRGMVFELFDLDKACEDWRTAAKLGSEVAVEFLKNCK